MQPVAPRPRARPAQPEAPDHGIYQPYDGPAPLAPVRDDVSGQLVPQQRRLTERVDLLAEVDRDEAEDLILSTLHQFLLAKTPPDVICQRMQISMGSYKWLREKLRKKIRDYVKAKDPHDYLAPMIAEMEEAKATAWREIALAPAKEWTRRMRAIEVINRTNADLARLLQLAGLFDNSPMRAPLSSDDEDSGGANVLKEMAAAFLSGGYSEAAKKSQMQAIDD